MGDELALLAEHLDVYDMRTGPWNPVHGEIEMPDGWELLPAGDAFVTRVVKAAGSYWLVWKPRAGGRGHRRQIGVLAPSVTIAAAQARAAETAQARARAREVGARARGRQEERYAGELTAAIVAYLGFGEEHAGLAAEIAREAAARAAVVGSGRVGRTQLIPLEERAALAARALHPAPPHPLRRRP